MNKDIVNQEMLTELLKENIDCSEESLNIIDIFLKQLYECFKKGKSVKLDDLPLFKVKKSISKVNEQSPRTVRNDRIIVTMKIALDSKTISRQKEK